MKTLGWYNDAYNEINKMSVPMNDRSHWFGDGVYDATYARNGKIMALDEHIDRFFNSAKLLDINLGFTKQYLADLLIKLLSKMDDDELFVYIQASRGGYEIRNHIYDRNQKANLWITLTPETILPIEQKLKLTETEDTRFLHCNIKTLNLLPSVMAARLAADLGCDECVFHRGDIVTECAHSNIHILKDGIFITHPADEYILPGIARAHLIKACHKLNIEVSERPFRMDELFDADEIIVSSCGCLCNSATSLDNQRIGGKAPELLEKLQGFVYAEWLEETSL